MNAENEILLFEADLRALNELRAAIYSFEFKTVNNLQLINGGGASILVSFLTQAKVNFSSASGYLFLWAVVAFIMGLLSSLILSYLSPIFLEARYRKDESLERSSEYIKYCYWRSAFLLGAACFFVVAIILSLLGWINMA